MARGALSVVAFALAVRAVRSGRRRSGHLLAMVGAEFGLNYLTQFCPLNSLLGRDTCAGRPSEATTPRATARRALERVSP